MLKKIPVSFTTTHTTSDTKGEGFSTPSNSLVFDGHQLCVLRFNSDTNRPHRLRAQFHKTASHSSYQLQVLSVTVQSGDRNCTAILLTVTRNK